MHSADELAVAEFFLQPHLDQGLIGHVSGLMGFIGFLQSLERTEAMRKPSAAPIKMPEAKAVLG